MLTMMILIWTVALLLWYYMSRRHIVILGSKLPGPKSYPFIGNALFFLGTPEDILKRFNKMRKRHKRIVAMWFGPKLMVTVYNAKDTETILKVSKTTLKSEEYRFLRPWLGESILISEGAKFRQNKKLLTPAFHMQNLRLYLDVFSQYAEVLVQDLEERRDQEEFSVHPYITKSAMHVLLETFMGVKKETLGCDALTYANAVERLGRYAQIRIYKVWLRFELFFRFSSLKKQQDKDLDIVHPLTTHVIRERKKEYLAKTEAAKSELSKDWPVFLDKFLEARDEHGLGLTDEDIKSEVMTMMFAGHDTTSVSIGFALCLLGLHPQVQDKLVAELDSIFGTTNRRVNYEDCKKMQYMEQVIQEAWRLFPPIPLVGKTPTEDIDLGDMVIPKGCTIAILIALIHRDPDQYENPNKFNPDNFLPEKIKQRNAYSFLPFSAGHRTCIGQKYAMLLIKVILTYILRTYKVSSTIPHTKYKLAAQTTLKLKDGFKISIKKRI